MGSDGNDRYENRGKARHLDKSFSDCALYAETKTEDLSDTRSKLTPYRYSQILTFAKIVSVRETFLSAWFSLKPKSLGPRIAGAKNRRNRKPLTAVYLES